jgi:RNA ligase
MGKRMNIELLNQYVSDGYVSKTKHPVHNIWIYNYTNKTQYERFWNEITLNCRGLVLDENYIQIARSYKKFFNIEELESFPDEHTEITKKMDGSLILLFNYNGEWITATKASFQSEQCLVAAKFLEEKYVTDFLNINYTYIFEIIYSENRIVIQYNEDKLVLLTIFEKDKELSYYDTLTASGLIGCEVVEKYYPITDFTELKNIIKDNEEGYVIRFLPSNFRMKIKGEEYCRLHRILTGVSSRNIWSYLSEGRDFNEIIDRVPDEFYNWVKSVVNELEHKHHVIYSTALNDFNNIIYYIDLFDRKKFAEESKQTTYPHLVFRLYDSKEIDKDIWKMIYPKHELPFKKNI